MPNRDKSGRSPAGTGSRALHGTADGVSALRASIPNAEAREIVEKLSEADRDCIIRMGASHQVYGGIATFNLHPHQLGRLRTPGLCRCEHQPGAYSPIERLTPLGRAVRCYLLASAIEARSAETVGLGPQGESASAKPDAQPESSQ